jgi:hypothetical protein
MPDWQNVTSSEFQASRPICVNIASMLALILRNRIHLLICYLKLIIFTSPSFGTQWHISPVSTVSHLWWRRERHGGPEVKGQLESTRLRSQDNIQTGLKEIT